MGYEGLPGLVILFFIFAWLWDLINYGIIYEFYWGIGYSRYNYFQTEIALKYENYRKYIRYLRKNEVYADSEFKEIYPYYFDVLEEICLKRIKRFKFSQIDKWKLSDWDKMSFAVFNDDLKNPSRIYFRTHLIIDRNNHRCQICNMMPASMGVYKKKSYYSINFVGALEPEFLTTICDNCWIKNVTKSIIEREHHKCRICGNSDHLFVIDKETWLGLNQFYNNTLEYDPDSLSTICDSCRFEKASPKDFEILVAELFKKMGYEVQHTGRAGDAGIDIILNEGFGNRTIVQCKKYSSKVGVATVRELYGSLIDSKTNRGVIVTTDDYTSGAKEFAKGKPIKLINGIELRKALSNYFL